MQIFEEICKVDTKKYISVTILMLNWYHQIPRRDMYLHFVVIIIENQAPYEIELGIYFLSHTIVWLFNY